MARNCKVITTCFAGREVREETDTCGDPPGPFMHSQNFPDAESVLHLLHVVHEFERKVDPGVACDTIIVNNDAGWKEGNRYLASIDGTKTFSGVLRIVTRENYGSSPGGYNHAFEQFRNQYDYWTFTEDDILISGDKYLTRCIETFERRDDTGFVAIQGLSSGHALHAHGGVGTTHARILEAVHRTWGTLPHRLRHESQDPMDHAVWGEVLFTHLMSRMGYRLVTVESDPPLYTFAYDYMKQARGLAVTRKRHALLPRALRRMARGLERWAEKLG